MLPHCVASRDTNSLLRTASWPKGQWKHVKKSATSKWMIWKGLDTGMPDTLHLCTLHEQPMNAKTHVPTSQVTRSLYPSQPSPHSISYVAYTYKRMDTGITLVPVMWVWSLHSKIHWVSMKCAVMAQVQSVRHTCIQACFLCFFSNIPIICPLSLIIISCL